MSRPSNWPLNNDAVRIIVPRAQLDKLGSSPLSSGCLPLAMGYYPNAEGHHVTRKQHDNHLLMYCTDGVGMLQTATFSGAIVAGDVLVLPSGAAHRYQADPIKPWTIFWFHFAGDHCAELIGRLGVSAEEPRISLGQDMQLISEFHRLLDIRQISSRRTAFEFAAALIKQILLHIALQQRVLESRSHPSIDLAAVQALMHSRLRGNLDLDELARAAGLSKYHFIGKYKKLTGHSPVQHFIQLKMDQACALLDRSDMAVKQVAAQLGYSDPLYFSRQFRRAIGLSPSDYREQRRA